MVFRRDSNWPTHGIASVGRMPIDQPVEDQRTEEKQTRRWPVVIMTATYKYLSEESVPLAKATPYTMTAVHNKARSFGLK